ncbi:unnamed protein product [Closterium sp. Yama58-4]|nr:unnamed protein product [Closterium sp. Yama58-4]
MASSFISQVRSPPSQRVTPNSRPSASLPAAPLPLSAAPLPPALAQVVLRVLRAYIRDADGAAASDLSVSLSGGSLTLRNFELNLPGAAYGGGRCTTTTRHPDPPHPAPPSTPLPRAHPPPVPPHVRVAVRRAWVGELRVTIPWAALGSQPVALALHVVRLHVQRATGGEGDGGQGTGEEEKGRGGGRCGGEDGVRESEGGGGGQQRMGREEGEGGDGGWERGGDGGGKEEEGGGCGGSDTDSDSSQGSGGGSSSEAGHVREELAELLALGGLRAFLQHTVLNASVTVTDVLLQYSTPSAVLLLRCDKLLLHSTAPDWTPAFVPPEEGVRKVLEVTGLSVDVASTSSQSHKATCQASQDASRNAMGETREAAKKLLVSASEEGEKAASERDGGMMDGRQQRGQQVGQQKGGLFHSMGRAIGWVQQLFEDEEEEESSSVAMAATGHSALSVSPAAAAAGGGLEGDEIWEWATGYEAGVHFDMAATDWSVAALLEGAELSLVNSVGGSMDGSGGSMDGSGGSMDGSGGASVCSNSEALDLSAEEWHDAAALPSLDVGLASPACQPKLECRLGAMLVEAEGRGRAVQAASVKVGAVALAVAVPERSTSGAPSGAPSGATVSSNVPSGGLGPAAVEVSFLRPLLRLHTRQQACGTGAAAAAEGRGEGAVGSYGSLQAPLLHSLAPLGAVLPAHSAAATRGEQHAGAGGVGRGGAAGGAGGHGGGKTGEEDEGAGGCEERWSVEGVWWRGVRVAEAFEASQAAGPLGLTADVSLSLHVGRVAVSYWPGMCSTVLRWWQDVQTCGGGGGGDVGGAVQGEVRVTQDEPSAPPAACSTPLAPSLSSPGGAGWLQRVARVSSAEVDVEGVSVRLGGGACEGSRARVALVVHAHMHSIEHGQLCPATLLHPSSLRIDCTWAAAAAPSPHPSTSPSPALAVPPGQPGAAAAAPFTGSPAVAGALPHGPEWGGRGALHGNASVTGEEGEGAVEGTLDAFSLHISRTHAAGLLAIAASALNDVSFSAGGAAAMASTAEPQVTAAGSSAREQACAAMPAVPPSKLHGLAKHARMLETAADVMLTWSHVASSSSAAAAEPPRDSPWCWQHMQQQVGAFCHVRACSVALAVGWRSGRSEPGISTQREAWLQHAVVAEAQGQAHGRRTSLTLSVESLSVEALHALSLSLQPSPPLSAALSASLRPRPPVRAAERPPATHTAAPQHDRPGSSAAASGAHVTLHLGDVMVVVWADPLVHLHALLAAATAVRVQQGEVESGAGRWNGEGRGAGASGKGGADRRGGGSEEGEGNGELAGGGVRAAAQVAAGVESMQAVVQRGSVSIVTGPLRRGHGSGSAHSGGLCSGGDGAGIGARGKGMGGHGVWVAVGRAGMRGLSVCADERGGGSNTGGMGAQMCERGGEEPPVVRVQGVWVDLGTACLPCSPAPTPLAAVDESEVAAGTTQADMWLLAIGSEGLGALVQVEGVTVTRGKAGPEHTDGPGDDSRALDLLVERVGVTVSRHQADTLLLLRRHLTASLLPLLRPPATTAATQQGSRGSQGGTERGNGSSSRYGGGASSAVTHVSMRVVECTAAVPLWAAASPPAVSTAFHGAHTALHASSHLHATISDCLLSASSAPLLPPTSNSRPGCSSCAAAAPAVAHGRVGRVAVEVARAGRRQAGARVGATGLAPAGPAEQRFTLLALPHAALSPPSPPAPHHSPYTPPPDYSPAAAHPPSVPPKQPSEPHCPAHPASPPASVAGAAAGMTWRVVEEERRCGGGTGGTGGRAQGEAGEGGGEQRGRGWVEVEAQPLMVAADAQLVHEVIATLYDVLPRLRTPLPPPQQSSVRHTGRGAAGCSSATHHPPGMPPDHASHTAQQHHAQQQAAPGGKGSAAPPRGSVPVARLWGVKVASGGALISLLSAFEAFQATQGCEGPTTSDTSRAHKPCPSSPPAASVSSPSALSRLPRLSISSHFVAHDDPEPHPPWQGDAQQQREQQGEQEEREGVAGGAGVSVELERCTLTLSLVPSLHDIRRFAGTHDASCPGRIILPYTPPTTHSSSHSPLHCPPPPFLIPTVNLQSAHTAVRLLSTDLLSSPTLLTRAHTTALHLTALGTPFPMRLTIHTDFAAPSLCPKVLLPLIRLARSLRDAWAAARAVRVAQVVQPGGDVSGAPTDDLRSGAFECSRAGGRVQGGVAGWEEVAAGQVVWGEDLHAPPSSLGMAVAVHAGGHAWGSRSAGSGPGEAGIGGRGRESGDRGSKGGDKGGSSGSGGEGGEQHGATVHVRAPSLRALQRLLLAWMGRGGQAGTGQVEVGGGERAMGEAGKRTEEQGEVEQEEMKGNGRVQESEGKGLALGRSEANEGGAAEAGEGVQTEGPRGLQSQASRSLPVPTSPSPPLFGYMVENRCPVPLHLGQHGTQEAISLPPGCSLGYSWRRPPSLVLGAVNGGKESERVEMRGVQGGAMEAAEETDEVLPQRGMGAGRAGSAPLLVRVRLAREGRWSAPLAVAPCYLGLPSGSDARIGLGGAAGGRRGREMAPPSEKAAVDKAQVAAAVDGSDGCSLTFLLTADACLPVSGPPFPPLPHGQESVWVRLILPSSVLPLPAPSPSSLPTATPTSAPASLYPWAGPLCVQLWPAAFLCNALPLPLHARLLPLQRALTASSSEGGHQEVKAGSRQEQQQGRDRGEAEVAVGAAEEVALGGGMWGECALALAVPHSPPTTGAPHTPSSHGSSMNGSWSAAALLHPHARPSAAEASLWSAPLSLSLAASDQKSVTVAASCRGDIPDWSAGGEEEVASSADVARCDSPIPAVGQRRAVFLPQANSERLLCVLAASHYRPSHHPCAHAAAATALPAHAPLPPPLPTLLLSLHARLLLPDPSGTCHAALLTASLLPSAGQSEGATWQPHLVVLVDEQPQWRIENGTGGCVDVRGVADEAEAFVARRKWHGRSQHHHKHRHAHAPRPGALNLDEETDDALMAHIQRVSADGRVAQGSTGGRAAGGAICVRLFCDAKAICLVSLSSLHASLSLLPPRSLSLLCIGAHSAAASHSMPRGMHIHPSPPAPAAVGVVYAVQCAAGGKGEAGGRGDNERGGGRPVRGEGEKQMAAAGHGKERGKEEPPAIQVEIVLSQHPSQQLTGDEGVEGSYGVERVSYVTGVEAVRASVGHVDACADDCLLSALTHYMPIALAFIQSSSQSDDATWQIHMQGTDTALMRTMLAHYITEGLLCVPRVIASHHLLLNPLGLLHSVRAACRDLLVLPVQGSLHAGPHGLLLGVGRGGLAAWRHVSQWTVASLSGFSSSVGRLEHLTESSYQGTGRWGHSESGGREEEERRQHGQAAAKDTTESMGAGSVGRATGAHGAEAEGAAVPLAAQGREDHGGMPGTCTGEAGSTGGSRDGSAAGGEGRCREGEARQASLLWQVQQRGVRCAASRFMPPLWPPRPQAL